MEVAPTVLEWEVAPIAKNPDPPQYLVELGVINGPECQDNLIGPGPRAYVLVNILCTYWAYVPQA